jgi:cytochrome P450
LTFAWLREHPQAVPRAVDEILRWDPPVHFARRFLGCETTLQGVTLEEGTEVRLCLAAANRDERKFDDPDRLELTRSNAAEHLSFGGGRHFCIGAYLARVEATIAVASLIHRFPKMELIDHEPPRRKHVAFPLIERMRLRLGPASSSPGESAHPLSEGERPHMYL